MGIAGLVKNNLTYYWRTNLAVVVGVATAVAVLAGALLVGNSVRASLRDLVLMRLGKTDHVISSPRFFREQLANDIQNDQQFVASGFTTTCPLISLEGTVSEASGTRAGGVQVYGVNDQFWKFHGREGKSAPQNREVYVSQSLAHELNSKIGDSLLLRIEKPSDVPLESLYGSKEDLGRTLRLTIKEELATEDLGEFSLRPQQGAVRAVFVPLALLQRELEQNGKVNTILVSEKTTTAESNSSLQRILKNVVQLDDYDVKLRVLPAQQSISLERSSTLIDDLLERKAQEAAAGTLQTSPVFSYVVNSINDGTHSIPYSLVTALDVQDFGSLKATRLPESPIVLNEWAARDLGAKAGDSITLEYFVWQDDGKLATKTADFEVASIQPIAGLAADRDLVPDYPGISESESMSDWNPPFPVDLARIRKQDEDYWKQYRTTPKAFIRLADGQRLWQSRFGKLTSVRLTPQSPATIEETRTAFDQKLRLSLEPGVMGLVTMPVRQQGLTASQGATDFGEYFLYFSFFLVISALLLTALFFKLGVEQRLREIGLMQAVGFPPEKIRRQFLLEGFVLAVAGSLLGLAGGLAYAQLLMYGLRTWWVDAVGTTMLSLHVSPLSLIAGGAGGVVTAVGCIYVTLRRLRKRSTRSLLLGSVSDPPVSVSPTLRSSRFVVALAFTVLGLGLLAAAFFQVINQTAGFFGGGTVLLIAMLCFAAVWLRSPSTKRIGGTGWPAVSRLGFRNTTYRPERSVLCIALIASATFIIVAVDAFRKQNVNEALDKKSGSGGYPLMAESLLPLIHDPNNPDGREALNLSGDTNVAVLANAQLTRFRLRPGDDTSCLNLYQPHNPRILGASSDFIQSNRFAFQSSSASSREETENPWRLLEGDVTDNVVPVIADANSLTYVLHLAVGGEFVMNRSEGPLRMRVVGALSDSVFQSELIMSEKNFIRLFPHEEGHRFFLIDAPQQDQAAVSAALEDRLTDFGFDVVPTSERLASFHRVENTYLSTFQMLGGLGLLLGTIGMSAVLLRNILERRRELALLRAVGYNSSHFTLMITAENALLLCGGLVIGTVAAALAIAPVFFSRGGRLPNISLGLLLLGVLICGLTAAIIATWGALRSPLIPALRAE
jgi:ABC-type antimicrobial peptide transport system permease subunit